MEYVGVRIANDSSVRTVIYRCDNSGEAISLRNQFKRIAMDSHYQGKALVAIVNSIDCFRMYHNGHIEYYVIFSFVLSSPFVTDELIERYFINGVIEKGEDYE